MKKYCILLLFLILFLSGCDYLKDRKYSGKVFDVRAEFWEGSSAHVEVWKNANRVSYDAEENIYDFYVEGRLVVLDNPSSVVLTEVGSTPPVSVESERYLGKKFDVSIINGEKVVKTWKNIEVKSADSERIQFLSDNQVVYVIPSRNETIIIKEMK